MFEKIIKLVEKHAFITLIAICGILSAVGISAFRWLTENDVIKLSTENEYGVTCLIFFASAFIAIEIITAIQEHIEKTK